MTLTLSIQLKILHKLLHVQITHKHDYKMFLPPPPPSYINKKLFYANLMAKKVLSRLNRIVWLVVKPYLIMNGLLACSLSLLSLSFSSFLYLSLCRLIRKCAGRQAGRQRDKIKIGIAPNASHMAQTLHVSVIHHGVENIAELFSNSSTVTLARLFFLFFISTL